VREAARNQLVSTLERFPNGDRDGLGVLGVDAYGGVAARFVQ
jgi:hypothetical protein